MVTVLVARMLVTVVALLAEVEARARRAVGGAHAVLGGGDGGRALVGGLQPQVLEANVQVDEHLLESRRYKV